MSENHASEGKIVALAEQGRIFPGWDSPQLKGSLKNPRNQDVGAWDRIIRSGS